MEDKECTDIAERNISFIYYNADINNFQITTIWNDKERALIGKGYKLVDTVDYRYFEILLNSSAYKFTKEIEKLRKEFK